VDGTDGPLRITDTPAVWDRHHAVPSRRRQALFEYAERVLGFTPLDVIDLEVPLAGVRGVGYVLPHPTGPVESGRHRVHLKGMLLSDAATGLLPDWAFFVRCVIDTDTLQPTASREALYEDDTLAAVREALGVRIRDWLTELAAQDPERLARFLAVHELGVKALARYDDELLRLMLPWLRFESATGPTNLADLARAHPVLHVTGSVEEFRQVAPIAAAQGLGVLNGGYTYDADVIARLPRVMSGVVVADLDADVVLASLDPADPDDELALAGFLAVARARLTHLDCDVVVRAFHPVSLPALYLDGRAARAERARAQAESEVDGLWSQILGSLRSDTPRAQLVLNQHSPLLRRLAGLPEPELTGIAVEALYGQALLMTHRPLRPADAALVNRAFGDLLGWATRRPAPLEPEGER
jgi:molecular chaperone HtpG